MTPPRLRIGLPSKGRLAEQTEQLLHQAGLRFRRQERSLFARDRELPVDIVFLRTADIPILCWEGAIGMGITGSDLVLESGLPLDSRLRLGIGGCRLALCVPEHSNLRELKSLEGCRVATTFPRVTQHFFRQAQIEAHLVPLSGSVEIMIQLGVADAVVDLVETGSTLAANGLQVLQELSQHETVVIQSPHCPDLHTANRVLRRLEGVVIANSYSLLEYNIPRSRLKQAEEITPGFKSPTVSALEDPEWCAVRVMVRHGELHHVMEQLELVGAVAILHTEIKNCRL